MSISRIITDLFPGSYYTSILFLQSKVAYFISLAYYKSQTIFRFFLFLFSLPFLSFFFFFFFLLISNFISSFVFFCFFFFSLFFLFFFFASDVFSLCLYLLVYFIR